MVLVIHITYIYNICIKICCASTVLLKKFCFEDFTSGGDQNDKVSHLDMFMLI